MLLTQLSSLRTLASTALAVVLAFPLGLDVQALSAQTPASAMTAPPVANRLTQPIDESSRVTLSGTVHPLARPANDRGAAPDDMQLDRLQIVLKRSDTQESALRQLITDLHTPGSASYHKWLTPDQFGQQFGPSDADIATLESWLASHGFGSLKLNAGHQTLEFSGSVAQFRDTFHAQIHKYQVNGETHYANSTDPQIPAALASVFGGFSSLNNFRAHRHSKLLGKATYDPATHQATPQWTTTNATEPIPNLILAPADYAVQYDLNPLYAAGTTGTGETIAIINDANINPVLVSNYRTLFFPTLPANPVNVIIDGNDPGIDGQNNPDGPNYDSVEAYLDVEQSGAVAPGATIDLVIAADTALENGLILAAEHAVYGNTAPILSLSFGACESSLGTGNVFLSDLWEQAAAQGITVLVSSGDSGSAGCDNPDSQYYAVGGQAVSGYASTPYDVAVGGTDFYYSGFAGGPTSSTLQTQLATYWNLTPTSNSTPALSIKGVIPEQAWNDSQYGSDIFSYYTEFGFTTIGAGSGGASNAAVPLGITGSTYGPYPKPSWQAGTGVPADSARDLPDVSLFAADGVNASYTPICAADGDCVTPATSPTGIQISGVGGTSVAAPSMAGIMALVDQKYGPQGQADFVLYPLAAQYPAAFHDVVNGTNSVPCNTTTTTTTGTPPLDCIPSTITPVLNIADPTYGSAVEGQIGVVSTRVPQYNAATGFDLATGLGSIDASVLVNDWGNVKFAASTVTLTPSSTTFTHGTAITISGTVTPSTATGSVALMTSSTTPLQAGQTTFPVTNGSYASTATNPINFLPGGTYNIWGAYSGDGTNAPSSNEATPTSITVSPENSSLYFLILNTASTSTGSTAALTLPVPYGTQLILSGEAVPTTYYTTCLAPTVSNPPASCNTATYSVPTGTVAFTDNGATLNTAKVNAEGDAEFNAPFAVGTHAVAASYSGDASYNPSTAAAVNFTVVKATPTIFLTPAGTGPAGAAQAGQPTTFTIQVENGSNAANLQYAGSYVPVAPPTGTVTITGLPSGPTTVTLAGTVDAGTTFVEGTAAFTAPASTPAGTYTITVAYSGDANYNAIPATALGTITIGAAAAGTATTTTVTSSATSTSITAGVLLTANVTAASGGAPTGYVVFSTAEGGAVQPLSNRIALVATSATTSAATFLVNSQNLQPGSNQINVLYLGSAPTFQPSSASIAISSGTGPGITGFALSATAVSVTAGNSGTSTITATGGASFSGTVAFTCTVTGSPASAANPPTCAAASLAVTAGATATTPLTINTTAPPTAKLDNPLNRIFTLGGGATLAALLLFGLPLRRRKWTSLPSLLSLLVFAVIASVAIGCGGSNSTPVTTNPTGGTTSGTYTVLITGTSSGSGTPVTSTTAIAVTVN